MGVLQWLLLILAIAGVVSFYVMTKRRDGPNPWQGMQGPEDKGDDHSLSEAGGSQQGQGGANIFDGLLGADDIPDLPADAPLPMDEELPDFEVRSQAVPEPADSQPELNPGKLKRDSNPADQRIIVLHVACKDGQYFQGHDVHAALRECKLQFGMQDVYHRITEENGIPETVFSIANMLKPGFLNPDEAANLETPGLTMFMVLPGPTEGVPAFKDMMETANQLAQSLGGEVLDDKRVLLKRQTAQYLLDEIAEDQRKLQLKQHA